MTAKFEAYGTSFAISCVRMTITEFIIIYLACGSPFGVQSLLESSERPVATTIIGVLTRFFVWPLSAGMMLYRLVAVKALILVAPDTQDRKVRLVRIRRNFEAIVGSGNSRTTIFEFRDTFSRYTGLAPQLDEALDLPGTAELFRVSGHGDATLATICLRRQVVSKLNRHKQQAQVEFVRMIDGLLTGTATDHELKSLAVETAVAVLDREMEIDLRRRFGISSKHENSSTGNDQKGELWNTGTQQHQTAS